MKKLNLALMAIFALILACSAYVPTVKADLWNRTCINNVEYSLFCNGLCQNTGAVIVNHTQVCQFGCNNITNSCDTAYNVPSVDLWAIFFGLVAVSVIFFVIGKTFNDDWGVIHLLFYICGLIFITASVSILALSFGATQTGIINILNVVYLAVVLTTIVFMFYVFMRFLVKFALDWASSVAGKKRGKR
jgi:hypothetical protein